MFSMTLLTVNVKVSVKIQSNHPDLFDKLPSHAFPVVNSESETELSEESSNFKCSVTTIMTCLLTEVTLLQNPSIVG